MKLQSRILYHCLLIPALLMAWGCDDMSNDVVPPEDKIDPAIDLSSTLAVNGPVLVDLVYGASFTGNATISIVEQPAKGTLAILNSALLKYTPYQDFTSGNDHATYKVCVDGTCNTGRIDFNYASPGAPCQVTAVYDHAAGKSTDTQVVVDVLKNDITCGGQFDVTTLKVVTQPEHGDAAPIDGLIFYHPEEGYQGPVHLIYSAALRSAPSVLYYGVVDIDLEAVEPEPEPVTVTAVNDVFNYTYAEFADLSSSGVRMNYSLESILGNDQIGDLTYGDLTITITRQPAHGNVIYFSHELFQWNPGSIFSGTDSFAYQICYNGQCAEGEVQITIAEPLGPKPVANPDVFELTRAQVGSGGVNLPIQPIIGNDNLDGLTIDDITISLSAQAETAQVIWYPKDVFEFKPSAAFTGQSFFKYQICYDGKCSEATVTVIVTDW